MPGETIPSPESLHREILASHRRCRQYGVDPFLVHNVTQARLDAEQLAQRRARNQDFLDVVLARIQGLYRFVAGAGFVVSLADSDGYILEMVGDRETLERLAAGNCAPGYRWSERDVGTSAISLAVARRIPAQINDEEHFCRRGYGHTCSAAPIFDADNRFRGVLAMSGDAHQVHPHTLGMVITAAQAVQNQLQLIQASREILLHNNSMNAIIESIDSGVMAVNRQGVITRINQRGRRILHLGSGAEGRRLGQVLGPDSNWEPVLKGGTGYNDREIFARTPVGEVQMLATAKPVFDSESRPQGLILVFQEIHRIRKLVNKMAGSQARFTFNDVTGTSPALLEAKRLAMLAAAGNSNVLLLGETGTGKELFAHAIHNHSKRRNHPFVAINCGAIPRELLESELFGYVEGAFTGARRGGRPGKLELAHCGTVFLDEIGDMPVDMQVKLLRVLQSGEVCRIGQHRPIAVDFRIIAATHCDLELEVSRGNFREDLFYRLNVFPIQIPALRHRPEDIIPLARHILKRCRRVLQKPGVTFDADAEAVLRRHTWPGNVRELENAVERAVNLVEGRHVRPRHLTCLGATPSRTHDLARSTTLLAQVERETIKKVTEATGFNISRAARLLGISRATLYNKLKQYQLPLRRPAV